MQERELKTSDRGGFIMFDGWFCVPFVYLLCRCLSSVMHNANVLAASAVAQCICIPFHFKELKSDEKKMREREAEREREKFK